MNKNEYMLSRVSTELVDAYQKKSGVNLLQVGRVYQENRLKCNRFYFLCPISILLGLAGLVILNVVLLRYTPSGYEFGIIHALYGISVVGIILWISRQVDKYHTASQDAQSQLDEFKKLINLFRSYDGDDSFLTKELAEENVRDLARQIIVGDEFLQQLKDKGVVRFDFNISDHIRKARDRMNNATGRAHEIDLSFDRKSMLQSVRDQMNAAELKATAKS
ncbi:MAG: hypothetical protein AAB381_01275 [Patescibacteria group bacterium]